MEKALRSTIENVRFHTTFAAAFIRLAADFSAGKELLSDPCD